MGRQWQEWIGDRLSNAGLWPAVCLVAIIVLWITTVARTGADTRAVEHDALRDVASYAGAYEHFLDRSVGLMDQTTMHLKSDWEKSRGSFLFDDLVRQGMFTDSAFLSVGIYDRTGVRITATKNATSPSIIAGTDNFRFHANNISTALRMTLPETISAERQQVLFSRRLDGPDDSFDGVIVMMIDADYFTSFYSAKTFGNSGMVAMVAEDSERHIERTGPEKIANAPLWRRPHDSLAVEDGAAVLVGSNFSDRETRFVGWKSSGAYPFTAVVSFSRTERMAASDLVARDRQINAVFGTLALLAFAALSFLMAKRLDGKKRETESVRAAYRMATDNASDGFYMAAPVYDTAGRLIDFEIVDCNERGAYFYTMSRAEMLGMRLSSVPPDGHGHTLIDIYAAAMESGFAQSDVCMPRDSRIRIEWAQRTLARAGNGLAITLHDISRHKNHAQELLKLANEDALTLLPNRYWLLNHLPLAIEHADASSSRLALLFIDLDGFKHVNDTQGHAIGDALLKVAALRLTGLLRPSDHVVRFGGDEFVVALDPLESLGQATVIAQRVLAAFKVPFEIGEETQLVGTSIGISVYPQDADDAMTLIKNSDIAMYAGKIEGKGQFRFYDPSLLENLKSKAQSKQDLVEAIEQDQLVLYYQPRVDTHSGALLSMEALVRWIHPKRGMIAPLEFIPMAELNGLICAIGEIVMEKACRQLADWKRAGLQVVPVSINVSPMQFVGGDLHRQLARHLTDYGVSADLLEVEITESAMMGNQEEVLAELNAIRALGIKLHIDDFGTGYSSLSQLQKLKMDVLKVDRSFTSELGNSYNGKIFFQAIVSMAHALGMTVVAEGVETAEQLMILQSLDCNEVQGYFISRPVPAKEMTCMMQQKLSWKATEVT